MQAWIRNGWAILLGGLVLPAALPCAPVASQTSNIPDTASTVIPTWTKTQELHNVWQLSRRVFSGSEPADDAAFAELVSLGVKTVVSVDGVAPLAETARKHGLRYVHIPVGYDGVSADAAQALTRVARDVPGTIYVHCHHGKHRGPAAAAILCRADDGRSATAAQAILEKAGTGREYPGLWRSVAQFRTPPPDASLPELAERAPVESLASAMAKGDRIFERVQANLADTEQGDTPSGQRTAREDSIQLAELFMEAARTTAPGELRQGLQSAGELAKELSVALAGADGTTSDKSLAHARGIFERLGQSCVQCHRQRRNEQ